MRVRMGTYFDRSSAARYRRSASLRRSVRATFCSRSNRSLISESRSVGTTYRNTTPIATATTAVMTRISRTRRVESALTDDLPVAEAVPGAAHRQDQPRIGRVLLEL